MKNLSLTFLLQVGVGKRPLEQQSSHICHHFHNSEKLPEHQPVRNISKTWFTRLYALIPFCFSCSTGSLGNTLQNTSSSPLCIPCAELHPFCLKYLLGLCAGEKVSRLWVQGFKAPAQTKGGTHCAEPHQAETHKTQTAEEKRKSHCNSLRASLSWKYSPPKEQGTHKGILCCVSLSASGQLWVLDTNSCHKSWDFSLQPGSSASLHKDHWWVCLTPFFYTTSPWPLPKEHG